MSNGHSQYFSDDIVGSGARVPTAGTLLHTTGRPSGGSGTTADAASKAGQSARLGMDRGDMRGLLPDLAGIAILVTALGSYGGFW